MVSLSELLTVRALMLLYVVCSTIDSSWDRSSPSLWSTSYYTSDSACSSPVISPAIQRRHLPKPAPPPKPKSKPIPIMGSKSLPEADTLSNFTTPSASPGSSSKGLDLFFRQMEKISKLGSDEQGRWFRGRCMNIPPLTYSLVPFCALLVFFELDLSSAWQWNCFHLLFFDSCVQYIDLHCFCSCTNCLSGVTSPDFYSHSHLLPNSSLWKKHLALDLKPIIPHRNNHWR